MLKQLQEEQTATNKHSLIRLEHSLQKAKIQLDKIIHALKTDSTIQLEFAYLLKNQRESILKLFTQTFSNETHGQIVSLSILNCQFQKSDSSWLFEQNANLFLKLEQISLQCNPQFPLGSIEHLINLSNETLTHLDLRNNPQVDDSIINIISSIANLTKLNLSNTSVTDKFISQLSNSKVTNTLVQLILARNHRIVSLQGFEEYPTPSRLLDLDLSFTKIFPAGFWVLKNTKLMKQLKSLDISSNTLIHVESSELNTLYSFPHQFSTINQLLLRNLRLTFEQLNIILLSELPNLTLLDLEDNPNLFSPILPKQEEKKLSATVNNVKKTLAELRAEKLALDQEYQIQEEAQKKEYQAKMKTQIEKWQGVLGQLDSLNLRRSGLKQEILNVMIQYLKKLSKLDISYNYIVGEAPKDNDDENEKRISMESTLIKGQFINFDSNCQIQWLGLGGINISMQSFDHFLSSNKKQLSTLDSLYLRQNRSLVSEQLVSLIKNQFCLSYLNISNTNLSNEGYIQLLSKKHEKLRDLRLSENNDIDFESVLIHLEKNILNLPQLKRISLGSSFSHESIIPQILQDKNIQIMPFFCDDLD